MGMKEQSFLQNRLVATKLFVPSFPARLVPRPRLIKRLDQSLQYKLTLLSAPAGFGKTTLLANWLYLKEEAVSRRIDQSQSNPLSFQAAWVSLDENDNEPVLFWQYILTALEQVQPGLGAPLLDQLQNLPIQLLLTSLLNRLLEYSQPVALVLDDYHQITNPQIHSSLSYLLDHLPPHFHFFIITRSEPPLPLSRLRARGQILEIDSYLLRCTLEETDLFLRDVLELNLSDELVQEIFNRTEGWLVGLQLISLSLQRHCPYQAVLEEVSGTQRYILDYLTQEVLYPQPPEVQDFLLYTSILPEFCASLCDAVMNRTGSQVILDYLETANLFIMKLDGQKGWYRYHQLFAEALRYRLNQLGPEIVGNLFEKTEQWYTSQEQSHGSVKDVQVQSKVVEALASRPLKVETETKPKAVARPVVLSPSLSASDDLPVVIEPLSERELEVLNLLTLGAANQDIAAQLTVSLNTVKKHTSNIFSKLGVPNRTQAVYLAHKLGLIVR
jgi:LuxR family maltose regulon positive regulatory protein